MSDAKLRQTLQRITSIVEAKVSDEIKREIGKSPASVGISANTIAREFVSSRYLNIRNATLQLPKVADLAKRSVDARSAGDTVLSKALDSDRDTAMNSEITERLKTLSLSISRSKANAIPALKKAIANQISEYKKSLWAHRALNTLGVTAASACVVFGVYNIFKSID